MAQAMVVVGEVFPVERRGPGPVLELVSPDRVEAAPGTAGLCRRLRLALYDLGLAGVIEATAGDRSVRFEELDIRRADALVRRLEDLASSAGAVRTPQPPSNPEQLQLDLGI